MERAEYDQNEHNQVRQGIVFACRCSRNVEEHELQDGNLLAMFEARENDQGLRFMGGK